MSGISCSTVALAILALAACARADALAGRVVQDHSGAPVASAEVRVYKAGVRGLAADLETDGQGRFGAPGLAPGEYSIGVEKPGYISARLSLRIGAGDPTALTLRLVRCGVITGRVTDAAGQPVAGVRVLAMAKGAGGRLRALGAGPGTFASVVESGRYRLYNLAPGEYAVAVSYGASPFAVGSTGQAASAGYLGSGLLVFPNNQRPEFFRVTGGEEYRGIDFAILPGASFSVNGRVELPAPKARFWVALTPVDEPAIAVAVTPADENGSFRLDGVPPGSYYLSASGPVIGYGGGGSVLGPEPQFGRTRVDVATGHVSGLSVAVQKGRSASVRLRAADRDAQTACPKSGSVRVTSLEDWAAGLDRSVQAGFEKETTIDHLAPGKYQLTASRLGENCYQTAEAMLDLSGADSGPVLIPVATAGSIQGRLLGAKPGEFAVILHTPNPPPGREAVHISIPDADGRFAFGSLPPGRYRVAAQRISESPRARWLAKGGRVLEIEVPGGTPAEVELPVPPAVP